jgi:hypothetical protein
LVNQTPPLLLLLPEEPDVRFPAEAEDSFAWPSVCRWNTLDFLDRSLAKLRTLFTLLSLDSSGELSGLQRDVGAVSSPGVGVTGLGAAAATFDDDLDLPGRG